MPFSFHWGHLDRAQIEGAPAAATIAEQLPDAGQAASRRPIEDEQLGGDIWFELVA
jgi:hypothetical protein